MKSVVSQRFWFSIIIKYFHIPPDKVENISDLEFIRVEVVDGVHSLWLLQEEAAQGLDLARWGRLEEGHHHDEQHHGQLPDPQDLRGLDVVDEGPQLGVELVGGDEVQRLQTVVSRGR